MLKFLSSLSFILIATFCLRSNGVADQTEQPLSEAATAERIAAYIKQGEPTEVWEPEPRAIGTGKPGSPPSDAIILFDGTEISRWESVVGGKVDWKIVNGAMIVEPGSGSIKTRDKFGDVQLHIEWRSPKAINGSGQDRGNSGIFFMERYELQILDSFNNPTYVNGQAGSVYKQHIPLVNASKGPGEWQLYDIVFMAPSFGVDGRVIRPATLTVFHNGVLIQNNVSLSGSTAFIGLPAYEKHDAAALLLQDHWSPVEYRNIWVRRL
jgi:hypothetical protein